jgi:hypothetical protein
MPQKPIILDANAVVCFLMIDNEADMFNRISKVLASVECKVPIEVVAETVYILDGYAKIKGNPVFTFDGNLRKKLGNFAFAD